MKIEEYIHSKILNNSNIITLNKYTRLFDYFKNKENYELFEMSEDLLQYNDICYLFSNIKNKIVIVNNVDIDFPPPKKPYSYDKYFDKKILPENYENIDYYEKIEMDLLNIIEKNNIKIYTFSLSINHPNIINMALGIFHQFNHFDLTINKKTILCYANFGIHVDRWFGNPRKDLLKKIQDKPYILQENIKEFGRGSVSNDHFYNMISMSKFTLCPRGCGIDSYRIWDAICLGSIPIVEKYSGHEQFSDLPILFVNDYEIINEDFLNEKYTEFMQKDFCYDKLFFQYWAHKIYEDKHCQ
jgi:hypothetical protein